MASVVYSNSKHLKLLHAILVLGISFCFAILFGWLLVWMPFISKNGIGIFNDDITFAALVVTLICSNICFFITLKHYQFIVVDEEHGTVINGANKYSMNISDIRYVSYKTTKKGKYRSLLVYGDGDKLLESGLNERQAVSFVTHVKLLNPDIEIRQWSGTSQKHC